MPLLGRPLSNLLQGVAHATGAVLLRRTGEQFFMLDGGGGTGGGGGGTNGTLGADLPVPAFGVADCDQPLLFQVRIVSSYQDVPVGGVLSSRIGLPCLDLGAFSAASSVAGTLQAHPPQLSTHAQVRHLLLVVLAPQMTQDVPSKGLFFYSGLRAFKTRTAYANTDGGWFVWHPARRTQTWLPA